MPSFLKNSSIKKNKLPLKGRAVWDTCISCMRTNLYVIVICPDVRTEGIGRELEFDRVASQSPVGGGLPWLIDRGVAFTAATKVLESKFWQIHIRNSPNNRGKKRKLPVTYKQEYLEILITYVTEITVFKPEVKFDFQGHFQALITKVN